MGMIQQKPKPESASRWEDKWVTTIACRHSNRPGDLMCLLNGTKPFNSWSATAHMLAEYGCILVIIMVFI